MKYLWKVYNCKFTISVRNYIIKTITHHKKTYSDHLQRDCSTLMRVRGFFVFAFALLLKLPNIYNNKKHAVRCKINFQFRLSHDETFGQMPTINSHSAEQSNSERPKMFDQNANCFNFINYYCTQFERTFAIIRVYRYSIVLARNGIECRWDSCLDLMKRWPSVLWAMRQPIQIGYLDLCKGHWATLLFGMVIFLWDLNLESKIC